MIADAINSALADVWTKAWGYLTLSFVDPFWGWLWIGIGICAAVLVITWFFSHWLPQLRAIGGVAILMVIWGLFTYRRGEKDARAHDKKWRRR